MYTFCVTKNYFCDNQDELNEPLEITFHDKLVHYTEKVQTSILQGLYTFLHFVIKSLHGGEGSFEQRRPDFHPIGTCNSCSIPAVPAKQNCQILLSSKSESRNFQTRDAEKFSSQLINLTTKKSVLPVFTEPHPFPCLSQPPLSARGSKELTLCP